MKFKVEPYQVNEGAVVTKRGEMQMEKSDVSLDRDDTFVSKPGIASQPAKPKPKKGKSFPIQVHCYYVLVVHF